MLGRADHMKSCLLDIAFANRYLSALYSYKNKETVPGSWKSAFDLSTNYWPIVLQHILMGINVPEAEIQGSIDERDLRVANKVHIITKPGMIASNCIGDYPDFRTRLCF